MPISDAFENSITEALSILVRCLSVHTTPAGDNTHSVIKVSGWQNAEALGALALYLVALRASVIDQAGRICSELIGNPRNFTDDLFRSVDEIVVQPDSSNESLTEWKSKWRNPWIAEGMWHCCMWVAKEREDLHPHGNVIAVDFSHISPKDHGLDVTALYVKEDGSLGMSFVETKAYRDNPNRAITDAVAMFKAIETGKHDTRLRQMVTSFRSVIDEQHMEQLYLSLWKNERILIPNPHYEATDVTVRWRRRRAVFRELTAHVVVMPHGVNDYDAFFDVVASEMRRKAQEVAAYV